ncbi:alpha/beta fold hydrolase [Streptomyces tagetis]|uniref:Lysophospholipase n=1 Tax=Streptomyces tagetis TaxID=2820809 RepID=A0A941AZU2_9ACTN|nr:alpha/beta fold hydrolase [Streptomyces sp. RG38]MBQ0825866.1 lysophospholipase [Streptomyces sp. RG38]
MADAREHVLDGTRGRLSVREWPAAAPPRYVALLMHGYGEHAARHAGLARVLAAHGAAVHAPDHLGHGRSAGERVLIEDFEEVVADVHAVALLARAAHPGLPLVLVGHSMGGLIASRYAQLHPGEAAALVLSGPVLGDWALPRRLLALEEIPDTPVSPAALSRDPGVGAAYAADPLVWHGPMKRPTLEAFVRTLDAVANGPGLGGLPLLWFHGEDDRLVPLSGSRRGVEALGAAVTERIVPGARHEVFQEWEKAAAFAELTRFLDAVLGGADRGGDGR